MKLNRLTKFLATLLVFQLGFSFNLAGASTSIYFRCVDETLVAGYRPGNNDTVERAWVFMDENKIMISPVYVKIEEHVVPANAKFVWYPADESDAFKPVPWSLPCRRVEDPPPVWPQPSTTTTTVMETPPPPATTSTAVPTTPRPVRNVEVLAFTGAGTTLLIFATYLLLVGTLCVLVGKRLKKQYLKGL